MSNGFVSSRDIFSQSKQTSISPISSQALPISPITESDPFEKEKSVDANGVEDEKLWPQYEDVSEGDIHLEGENSE